MAAVKQPLKAHELVGMCVSLLNLDVAALARVANVPTLNLVSWLAGKKDNLRSQSIVALLAPLGFKLDRGIRLDDARVHFWHVDDGLGARFEGYNSLTKLSKLLAGCMITRVAPPKDPFLMGRRDYFMVSGEGVRLVLVVRKRFFRPSRIGPEIIKGACWRDEDAHHTIRTTGRRWALLTSEDMTVHEFDWVFNRVGEDVTWGDLSLIAREFGVTAQQLAEWIRERFGESTTVTSESDDRGSVDIDGGGQLLALARRAA